MTYSVTGSQRLRLVDFNSQPWDTDVNWNFSTIASAFDGFTNPSTLLGFKNAVMNGDFGIWQRGITRTLAIGSGVGPDRWRSFHNGSGSVTVASRQTATSATLLDLGCKNYLKYAVTTAGTGQTVRQFKHSIENARTFSGRACVLSFVAWGTVGDVISYFLSQYFGSGGSPSSGVNTSPSSSVQVTLTATPTLYTVPFTLPSVSGKTFGTAEDSNLMIVFSMPQNKVTDVNLGAVQLEVGTSATTFAYRPHGEELALCQRYFEHSYGDDITDFTFANDTGKTFGTSHPTALFRSLVPFKVTKRATPTIATYDHSGVAATVDYYNGAWNGSGVLSSPAPVASKSGFFAGHGIASSTVTQFGWTADAEFTN